MEHTNDANLKTNSTEPFPFPSTEPPAKGKRRKTTDAPDADEGERKPRGRKGADGIEMTITISNVKDGSAECMKLFNKSERAKTLYKEAIKKVAESGGIQASTLNKWIKASAKGKFADVKRDIEQQALVFDECGECAGGIAAE